MTLLVAPLEVLTDSRLTDSERRVLLALFSYRGKNTNTVWPSLPALAERAQMKDHTRISKLTKSLSDKGWLTKKKRGFTGCNEYTLTVPDIDVSNLDSDTKLEEQANMAPDTKSNLDSDTNSNLDSDTKYKEQTNEQTNEHTNTGQSAQALFDRFWSEYPKKKAKQAALRAWKKLKPSPSLAEQIIEAVIAQRRWDDWQREGGRFIPNPATWLNGGCWEDQPMTGPKNQEQPRRRLQAL